ncbi:MAG: putative selenoprotein, partial [Gammaproteobacteria bacterium]|nr:putative selenoprotein [Gammaproteobacteria bacterium]MCB1747920.1 putative selenoprotein [Gammaproteobacteria bacterium]
AAYATWCRHLREHHPGEPLPSRAEFYRAQLERRAGEIRRCC